MRQFNLILHRLIHPIKICNIIIYEENQKRIQEKTRKKRTKERKNKRRYKCI